MDSSLSYDGTNTDTGHTMTLSGGSTWAHDEDLTLTSSASFFVSTDVGNEIFFVDSNGDVLIRFEITAYTSPTVVTGRSDRLVPASLRATASATWIKAVDEISGLWHLEGKDVSIFADGFVVASPNNVEIDSDGNEIEKYTTYTVTDGMVTLDKPYGVIHIGLPITSDIETLDIDSLQGQSMADKKKHISALTIFTDESRGIFAGSDAPIGDTVTGLTELKVRQNEGYDEPVALKTGTVDINITGKWSDTGKVFIRQVDPLPLSILAVIPSGFIAAS